MWHVKQSLFPLRGRKPQHPRRTPGGLEGAVSLLQPTVLTCSPRHTSPASSCGSAAHCEPAVHRRPGCCRCCLLCVRSPRSGLVASGAGSTQMAGPPTRFGARRSCRGLPGPGGQGESRQTACWTWRTALSELRLTQVLGLWTFIFCAGWEVVMKGLLHI